MPHPHLIVEHSLAGYRWLRLARPERRNALDVSLMLAVRDLSLIHISEPTRP